MEHPPSLSATGRWTSAGYPPYFSPPREKTFSTKFGVSSTRGTASIGSRGPKGVSTHPRGASQGGVRVSAGRRWSWSGGCCCVVRGRRRHGCRRRSVRHRRRLSEAGSASHWPAPHALTSAQSRRVDGPDGWPREEGPRHTHALQINNSSDDARKNHFCEGGTRKNFFLHRVREVYFYF